MENLLDRYLIEHRLNCSQFARVIKCQPGAVRTWRMGLHDPSPSHAWKVHKGTKGSVPITYWGYVIINGKIKRIDNEPITAEAK